MARFAWTIGAVVIASFVLLIYGMNRYARFDVSDAEDADIAERYRFVCGAYGDVRIDQSRIPADLTSLIPYAEQFGHSNAIIRKDCAAKMSVADARKFSSIFDLKKDAVEMWLRQFPADFPADEVRAFRQLLLFHYEIAPAATASDRAA
jgi:hypothetical protein